MKPSLFTRHSLQHNFIIVASVSIILLMSVVGYIVTTRESRLLYSDIEREGRLLAETLAIPVTNDLLYEMLGLVEEGGLLDNYITGIFNRKDTNLLYLTVLDSEGRVISHNDLSEYGMKYSDQITLNSLRSHTTTLQKFRDRKRQIDLLDIATPLQVGGKRWGTLKFGMSLEKFKDEIRATITTVVLSTMMALIVSFGIILILSRRFIGPITDLAKTMERAGGEMLDLKVDIRGRDEIALLGQSFNRMIQRIREANLELKETHKKLLQSEKLASMGILASGVAHEVNNPLGGIFNCVQMLEENGEDSEFRKKYLALLKSGLDKIEITVGKLLWMAREEEREPDYVRLKQILHDIHSLIEYRLNESMITYKEEVNDSLIVFMDPHDLQQILLNLMINAIHSMKGGGKLYLRAYGSNSDTVIEVSDTGSGIEGADRKRLFDPFYTTKAPGEGTGLGLWLTYELIKAYNGEINVTSEPGKGSTFRIVLRREDEREDSDH